MSDVRTSVEGVLERLRRGTNLRGATIDELEQIAGKPARRIVKALEEAGVVLKHHRMNDRPPFAWSLIAEPEIPADWLDTVVDRLEGDKAIEAARAQLSFDNDERVTRRRLDEFEQLIGPEGDESTLKVELTVSTDREADLFERLIFERYNAQGRTACLPSSVRLEGCETLVSYRTPNGVLVLIEVAARVPSLV